MYEIRTESVPMTAALESAVLRKVEWLKRFHPGVIRCRVTLAGPGPHHRHGDYRVKLMLHVRGAWITATGNPHASIRAALTSAFHVARRCLEDQLQVRRHQEARRRDPVV